jgi:hypothetical protein
MTWHHGPPGIGRYLTPLGLMCRQCVKEWDRGAVFEKRILDEGETYYPATEPGECEWCEEE